MRERVGPGGSLQVRVFAGIDPVTRRDRYLSETVEGSDRPARREAEKVMARLQTEVDGQRSAPRPIRPAELYDPGRRRPSPTPRRQRTPPGSSMARSRWTTTGARSYRW